MPTIGSILSTARNAMLAQQAGVQVTSHNIANASVDGYSRQRAQFATNAPNVQAHAVFGTGVKLHDVARMREAFLDHSFREATSESAGFRRRFEMLSQVEGLFMEPSDAGLGAGLDAFFSAWGDLANNPLSDSARAVVRESAVSVVAHFRRLVVGLEQVRTSGVARLEQEVGELNHLTAQVAQLNARILAAESGGNEAGDLRDSRDRALDRIAELVPAQFVHRTDGSIAVAANGALLVDGSEAVPLEVVMNGTQPAVRTVRGTELALDTGTIGATLVVLRNDLPAARRQLDQLATALVTAVNAVHGEGVTPAGGTGVPFFAVPPGGVNADNIDLSEQVRASTRNIAAGTGEIVDGVPVYRSGRIDIAARLAELRDAPLPGAIAEGGLDGSSLHGFYGLLVTQTGMSVRSAAAGHDVNATLAFQADLRRTSVSGVSIDEELVNLIRYQNAYAAAARVVSTADEMLQTVLGMVR